MPESVEEETDPHLNFEATVEVWPKLYRVFRGK